MRRLLTIFWVAILLSVLAREAPAKDAVDVTKCDTKLFLHVESETVRKATFVHFLDLVTRDNYEEVKKSFKSSWDGPYGFFKGDFDSFDQKRENYRKEINYTFDEKYSRDHAVATLGPNGLRAYELCLLALNPKSSLILTIAPDTSIDTKVTVNLILHAQDGEPADFEVNVWGAKLAHPIKDKIDEEKKDGPRILIDRFFTKRQYTFDRIGPKAEFRITASGSGYTANTITIPPKRDTRIQTVPIDAEPQTGQLKVQVGKSGDRRVPSYDLGELGGGGQNGEFNGSFACLCASGTRHAPGNGRCVAPVEKTWKIKAFKYAAIPGDGEGCGGTILSHPKKPEIRTDVEVCFVQQISLNGTDPPSVCSVRWFLTGKLEGKQEVFVMP